MENAKVSSTSYISNLQRNQLALNLAENPFHVIDSE